MFKNYKTSQKAQLTWTNSVADYFCIKSDHYGLLRDRGSKSLCRENNID